MMKKYFMFMLAMMAFGLTTTTSEANDMKKAVFAGGCFWCMEAAFDKMDGVVETISGFTGGHVVNPSYKQVVKGDTGHLEAVEVTYDADKISYVDLLEVYWGNVDPLDAQGQFCDKGSSYKPAIFVSDDNQRALAEASKVKIQEKYEDDVKVAIHDLDVFYDAEEEHQDYHEKNPFHYELYYDRCGRKERLEELK